ncbi:Rid family hydrolase [Termitidicoccus mucosus]|uniref:Translation initiation inhibitor n=1 Tax=Termitidicoccus mucosus TaxID=1184151 RepID=A0A178INB6_9BACT|nr:hypothetical protein AW736_07125 [Opitutaceae bacterium TSB47]
MEYLHKTIEDVDLEISLFSKNGVDEIHLLATPNMPGTFPAQVERIIQAQNKYLRENEMPGDALVFSRYFVSDYANQSEAPDLIRSLSKGGGNRVAVSIVQQPPLTAAKVVAWSYIIHDKNRQAQDSRAISDHDLLVRRGDYHHLWSTRLLSDNGVADSAGQTNNILRAYNRQLEKNGFLFKNDCIRTWLFVKDIDFNYQGVVDARREFFDELGLTADTHFVASTGIEGRHANPGINVMLDAYSVGGLAPGQIRFLEARENLNPTHEYGVTFERGTSVDYGDRRHVFISGTASINNKGEILHRNDVRKQAARAIDNIIALLRDADASMRDVAHLIIYLRDIADTPSVRQYFQENYRDVPKALVLAPVCRPGWLIEIECMAIKPVDNPSYGNF